MWFHLPHIQSSIISPIYCRQFQEKFIIEALLRLQVFHMIESIKTFESDFQWPIIVTPKEQGSK